MGNASTELELDCRAAGHIFCRQAEIGFGLERDLTRSFGRSRLRGMDCLKNGVGS